MTPDRPRTAIVTGGTAGIGLAIAKSLLRRGHRTFVCGRDKQRLDSALRQLWSIDADRVGGTVCDVRKLSSVRSMVDIAKDTFGQVDTLINSAGIAFVTQFSELSPKQWRDIIDTNLTGVFNCSHAIVPLIKGAGGGDIVNLGSRSGRYAFSGGVGYNTTKFGLQGFTEALFLDLQSDGIRVSLVAPGTVATELSGRAPESWQLDPTDVAKVVADLLEADPRACLNWVEIRPTSRPAT